MEQLLLKLLLHKFLKISLKNYLKFHDRQCIVENYY